MIFRDFVLKDPLLRFLHHLSNGYKLYAVGGIVRDYLLGRKSLDYDIVVVGNFRDIVNEFLKKYGGKLIQITEFGTAKIKLDGIVVDIARARKESYPEPGSLPVVKPSNNIFEDLKRRDFTINAMAISLNLNDVGRLIDPFSGYEDLFERKLLRVLKDRSFYDDPTRAFRGVRYKNRFELQYENRILKQEIPFALEILPRISFARVRNELERTAIEEKRADMFKEIKRFGLLDHLGERLDAPDTSFDRLDEILTDLSSEHWLPFTLLVVQLREDLPDLKRHEKHVIKTFREFLKREIPDDPIKIHEMFYNVDEIIPLLIGLIKGKEILVDYYHARKQVKIHVSGDVLVSSGIRKENIRRFLIELFVKKWLGEIKSKDEELNFIKKWTS